MKKLLFGIFLVCHIIILPIRAEISASTPRNTEMQTDMKNAYKALLQLTAYDAEGKVLHKGTALFIDEKGTCAASYSLLVGAYRAEVADFKGNVYPIHRILGAGNTYDLVKFSVGNVRKHEWLPVTNEDKVLPGISLSLLHYTTDKKAKPLSTIVTKVDEYGDYKYFHISAPNDSAHFGCPLVDENGNFIGLVQQSVGKNDSTACAIDSRFIGTLNIVSRSAMNSDLLAIHLPKALPEDEKEALTYLSMLTASDTANVLTSINDFIAVYPENPEGYVQRAALHSTHGDYASSEADFEKAVEKSKVPGASFTEDAVRSEWSKTIYQKALYQPEPAFKDWSFKRAAEEADKAYAIRPVPYYLLQQGRCLFSNKQYGEAYKKFEQLSLHSDTVGGGWSDVARAESWFYAARSLELSGGDSLKVIALIDSAITYCPKPYTSSSAQYFIERAGRLFSAGEFKKAALDYNTYENIIGTKRLSAHFYYVREQAELEGRMYKQALDDIRTAISRAPEEPLYRLEEVLILLRAGENEEAVTIGRALVKDFPDIAEGYKLLGLALGESGKKAEAVANLRKAQEKGDESAAGYITRYQ